MPVLNEKPDTSAVFGFSHSFDEKGLRNKAWRLVDESLDPP